MPPFWPRRKSTTIEFPPFATLSASISFDRMNQDTARDLLLTYFWKVGDSATGRDTSRTLVVFNQRSLDTTASIIVAGINGFQIAPYFAMELRPGMELSQPEVRDNTGRFSYILLPVTLLLPGPPPRTALAEVSTSWQVQLSPNPAHGSTEMTGRSVPAGDWLVEIINVNGALEQRQEVQVPESGDLFTVLDLKDLSSGYHVVVLHGREASGSAASPASKLIPIIITR